MRLEDLYVMPHYRERFAARFWDKVDVQSDTECWPWTGGYVTPDGYGTVSAGAGTCFRAHRVAFMLEHGEVDDALGVLHSCDNPPCCNPAHLWQGTHQGNMKDKIRKGRHLRGELDGRARLREAGVLEVCKRLAVGEPCSSIAPDFGVSATTIFDIWTGKSWGWLTSDLIANVPPPRPRGRGAVGEKHANARLTEADVVSIRRRFARGGVTKTVLAREYGVGSRCIGKVIRRETWRHLPPEVAA
ncbi:MAG: HNH endonuclease [Actinomycetota bacterium]|nr:HNH endonuclease [Actinomycetota bacterium]